MLPLAQILTRLKDAPDLVTGPKAVSFETVLAFVELTYLLKPQIALSQSFYFSIPPSALPEAVHAFLQATLSPIQAEAIDLLWTVFSRVIWDWEWNEAVQQELGHKHISRFLTFGGDKGIGKLARLHRGRYSRKSSHPAFYYICPPTRTCLDPACTTKRKSHNAVPRRRELSDPKSMRVSVFSHEFGAIPGIAVSLYCRGCKTTYRHNYYVHEKASKRTYYVEQPRFIQSAMHTFIDRQVCEMFSSMMVHAWTSASNCARIYNEMADKVRFKGLLLHDYPKKLELDVETVWNSLFLFWLIEQHTESKTCLELDHNESTQAFRLESALKERNLQMVGTGQEEWSHVCDLCCEIKKSSNGQVDAALGRC
ncbi:hypothetical protein NMY22_g17324 [Coprinellus aureogranulatus]|nr:hypothetical protein NMY22_g17324 [Coprinellus aureogranulatus]